VKSQPLPKKEENPILKAMASNFDKIVKDESKDVLIEFFTREYDSKIFNFIC
jgi:hypothetical protein